MRSRSLAIGLERYGFSGMSGGICAVPDVETARKMPSGVYVINPGIAAPTSFVGAWPVSSVDEIKWDGLFFMGLPWPDRPAPPPMPEPEITLPKLDAPIQAPPLAGKSSGWLPCGHGHA